MLHKVYDLPVKSLLSLSFRRQMRVVILTLLMFGGRYHITEALECHQCDTGAMRDAVCDYYPSNSSTTTDCTMHGWMFVDKLNLTITEYNKRVKILNAAASRSVPMQSLSRTQVNNVEEFCYSYMSTPFHVCHAEECFQSPIAPGDSLIVRGCLTEAPSHLRIILKGSLGHFEVSDQTPISQCFHLHRCQNQNGTQSLSQETVCFCNADRCNSHVNYMLADSGKGKCQGFTSSGISGSGELSPLSAVQLSVFLVASMTLIVVF